MKLPLRRSTGMEQTLTAPASEIPDELDVAFERLYRECRDDVHAYAAGLLRDRPAAEDVTALAFERAWRKRRSFNPKRGTRRAWLFGIVRNAALDELRRRKRHAELNADAADPDAVEPADAAEVEVLRTAVRAALAELTARERELVALKFFAGLSNAEIATVVGTSESNAGTRLHRVIEKLRARLDMPGAPGEGSKEGLR
jgi:RNA polymerase sigma factor (sigma-70 family)